MKRFQVADKAEFEARQQCLDFGDACRAVLHLALDVKKALGGWAKGFLRNFRAPRKAERQPEQLRLNLLPWMLATQMAGGMRG